MNSIISTSHSHHDTETTYTNTELTVQFHSYAMFLSFETTTDRIQLRLYSILKKNVLIVKNCNSHKRETLRIKLLYVENLSKICKPNSRCGWKFYFFYFFYLHLFYLFVGTIFCQTFL